MSSLDDRRRAPRKSIAVRHDFLLVLAVSLSGLLVSAMLAASIATEPVLLAWAYPV